MSGSVGFKDYQKKLSGSIEAFEKFFQAQIQTFEPELKDVITAVLGYPGKRLRPLFVFASAGMLTKPSEQALRIAAATEFIHLATLVHDDILDGAHTRHGAPAHHQKFTPQISVLTGDTLFLRANELAAMEDDLWVGRVVSAAAKATCSGEILQGLRAATVQPLDYPAYERQILLKTGKLFGLSCALGGYLAKLPEATRKKLARYGELFGIAYQLYDDAVDVWGDEIEYKKTLRTDQIQGKWTLPWILLSKEISAASLNDLWNDRAAALKAFETHVIFKKSQEVLETYLTQAAAEIAELPQELILAMPLAFIRGAWGKLTPMKVAVNQ